MPRNQRILMLALAAAVLVAAFAVLSGDDEESPTATRTKTAPSAPTPGATARQPGRARRRRPRPPAPTVVVRDGRPVGGIARLRVRKGERVVLRVRSDAADEAHVHGYELLRPVRAGVSTTLRFRATIDGIFEVELEGAGRQIASITVVP